jgi:hypothetical protein
MNAGTLSSNPHIQHIASMPEELYQMLKKTDPLRAEIVQDCRNIVAETDVREAQ